MLEKMLHRDRLRQQLAETDEVMAAQTANQLSLQKTLNSQRSEARSKIDIFENAFR
jgi:hypothetical protein